MNHPLVSVIIPAFNNGPFIAAALNSVFRQSSVPCEVIVVDDGSTDDTKNILRSYRDRVVYCHQTNRGAAAARNCGLARAKGEYIAFLDGDDVWFGGNLAMKIGYLANNPGTGAVFSNFRIFDSSGVIQEDGMRSTYPIFRGRSLAGIFEKKSTLSSDNLRCFAYEGYVFESLLFGNFIATCSMVARRKCIDYVGAFREDLWTQEDYDYWLRLSRKYDIAFIDVPLVGCRRHYHQITRSNMDYLILDVARVLEPYRRDIGLLPKPVARRFRKRYSEVMNLLGIAFLKKGKRKEAAWAFKRGFYLNFGNLNSLALWLSTPLWEKSVLDSVLRAAKMIKDIRLQFRGGKHADTVPATARRDEGEEKISVQDA